MGKKKKNKIGLIVAALISVLLVGSLAALSDGFKNWNTDEWFETRENLEKLDLRHTTSNSSKFTESDLLDFLNESCETSSVFDKVENTNSLYKSNGGLKFGNSSNGGNFKALFKDFEFNHIKLKVQSYYSFIETENIYNIDPAEISINGSDYILLSTNEEDTSKNVKIDIIELEFKELQNYLEIVSKKRLMIYEIEIWTEEINKENVKDPVNSSDVNSDSSSSSTNSSSSSSSSEFVYSEKLDIRVEGDYGNFVEECIISDSDIVYEIDQEKNRNLSITNNTLFIGKENESGEFCISFPGKSINRLYLKVSRRVPLQPILSISMYNDFDFSIVKTVGDVSSFVTVDLDQKVSKIGICATCEIQLSGFTVYFE